MRQGIIPNMSSGQSLIYKHRLDPLHGHPHFPLALRVIVQLERAGFQSVFAGGSVRDGWLGATPKDLDLATAAPPETVEKLFPRTIAVGKAFGTIVVIEGGVHLEITTFRKDGPYLDGRHPSAVEFSDMQEDARRRDFTINALFYDAQTEEIYDFVGGIVDLNTHRLRTVGLPAARFQEDRLRMLRAARFVAQTGFELEQKTLGAILEQHQAIQQVSSERVFNEITRLLKAPFVASGLKVLLESQLSTVIWPELNNINLSQVKLFTPFRNWENAFAAVMLLSGSDQVEARLRSWKAPRESLRRIETQMGQCKILMNPASTRAERARVLGAPEFAETLHLAAGFMPNRVQVIQGWIAEFLSLSGPLGILPKPILTGQDLIAAGVHPGEKMGQLLKTIYEQQLEGAITSRDGALKKLKSLNS